VEDEQHTIYRDASKNGMRCIMMKKDKVIAYASRQLRPYEENNYPTHNFEISSGGVCL